MNNDVKKIRSFLSRVFRYSGNVMWDIGLYVRGRYEEDRQQRYKDIAETYCLLIEKKFRFDKDIDDDGVKVVYEDRDHKSYADKNKGALRSHFNDFRRVCVDKFGKTNPELYAVIVKALEERLSTMGSGDEELINRYLDELTRVRESREKAAPFWQKYGLN